MARVTATHQWADGSAVQCVVDLNSKAYPDALSQAKAEAVRGCIDLIRGSCLDDMDEPLAEPEEREQ